VAFVSPVFGCPALHYNFPMLRRAFAVAIAALSVAALPGAQRGAEPSVPVGVWYGGGTAAPPFVSPSPAAERDAWRRDLHAIRAAGFNSIRSWVDWRSAAPERIRYDFTALEQLLTLTDDIGLKAIVQVYTDAAPDWLVTRNPDAKVVPRDAAAPAPQAAALCVDHPAVRTEMAAFTSAVARQAATHPSFHAIDVRLEPSRFNSSRPGPPADFCYCPHTLARFREWLKARYGTLDRLNAAWSRPYRSWEAIDARTADAGVWRTFNADKAREDLKAIADASPARGSGLVTAHAGVPEPLLAAPPGYGRGDDWWMARAVDQYGAALYPAAAAWSPAELGYALDAARSASQDRGWWLAELQAGHVTTSARAPVTGADLRLWGWAAISRGARAIDYLAWYPQGEARGSGLVDADGALTDRAAAAGELAGEVTRNARLYAGLRPRRSAVATLFTAGIAPPSGANDGLRRFYDAMFERNIQVDVLHPDEVVAGAATKYRVVHVSSSRGLPPPVTEMLKAFVLQGGTLLDDTTRPASAAEIQAAVAAARVTPHVAIGTAQGLVEARFLESSAAILLVAINHADTPQTVTMAFPPETPEAIWQNMESGAAVNFIQGATGPTYTYRFAPRDVLVLVRGKRLR
jgi:beta-galactosidase